MNDTWEPASVGVLVVGSLDAQLTRPLEPYLHSISIGLGKFWKFIKVPSGSKSLKFPGFADEWTYTRRADIIIQILRSLNG